METKQIKGRKQFDGNLRFAVKFGGRMSAATWEEHA